MRAGAGLNACADLFLFPSLTETYGNVAAEAMASGLPVLAYRSAAAERFEETISPLPYGNMLSRRCCKALGVKGLTI
ncbi:MAG TPA: glycosyltransferase [Azonexus sp.]|nr:glycosyltransferase [Azonexus sp.]